MAKVIKFWWRYVKNKRNVLVDTLLDFPNISSYLTFKLFEWKKGCAICFELKMSHTSLTPLWKVLKNWNPLTALITFTGRSIFWLLLLLKCYNFSMAVLVYKCIVSCNRHFSRNLFTHIYACVRIFVSKKTWYCEIIVKILFLHLNLVWNLEPHTLFRRDLVPLALV